MAVNDELLHVFLQVSASLKEEKKIKIHCPWEPVKIPHKDKIYGTISFFFGSGIMLHRMSKDDDGMQTDENSVIYLKKKKKPKAKQTVQTGENTNITECIT